MDRYRKKYQIQLYSFNETKENAHSLSPGPKELVIALRALLD